MRTRWYKNAVIYQVYPFSYMDSNNDGWGDIEGIISRLDYIKNLGVTAIWFSPLYQSPDYDYGYDISDYRAIDKKFGTMQDFDRLVEECHKRDLKVIMDMVFNHTSIEHEWFRQAIASEDSPYRDYYIIRKGKRKASAAFQLGIHLYRQRLGEDQRQRRLLSPSFLQRAGGSQLGESRSPEGNGRYSLLLDG